MSPPNVLLIPHRNQPSAGTSYQEHINRGVSEPAGIMQTTEVFQTRSTEVLHAKPILHLQGSAPDVSKVSHNSSITTFGGNKQTCEVRLHEAVVVPPPIQKVAARLQALRQVYQLHGLSSSPFTHYEPHLAASNHQQRRSTQQQQQQQQAVSSQTYAPMYTTPPGKVQGRVPSPSYNAQMAVNAGMQRDYLQPDLQAAAEALNPSHMREGLLAMNALWQPSQSPAPAASQGDVVLPGLMINAQSVAELNKSTTPQTCIAQDPATRNKEGLKGRRSSRKPRCDFGLQDVLNSSDMARESSLESAVTDVLAESDCQPPRRQRKSAQVAKTKIKRCYSEESAASDLDVDELPQPRSTATRHKRQRTGDTSKVMQAPIDTPIPIAIPIPTLTPTPIPMGVTHQAETLMGSEDHSTQASQASTVAAAEDPSLECLNTSPEVDDYDQWMDIDDFRQVGPYMGLSILEEDVWFGVEELDMMAKKLKDC